MRVLIFGMGYVGQAVAERARRRGWTVAATMRGEPDPAFRALGVTPVPLPQTFDAAAIADVILVTAAPDEEGCPGFGFIAPALRHARPRWIGYLSTTGVYGDWGGRWVFEHSDLKALSQEGIRRVAAEQDWLNLTWDGLPVTVFRLPGIYGPGRSPFDRLRKGQARSIVREGQVFSRIHIDDLAAGIMASIDAPRAGAVYNLVDDEPAPAHVVTAHAARLLGLPPPAAEPYDPDSLRPEARRFYAESKRVSNALAKAELGWRPAFPTYREGLAAILQAERVTA
jgi:nucleoside-diphosphate-sugar epimerase